MASTGLRRTLSGNGNQYTATFSVWVKRASNANDARIYTSWYDGNNQGWITFTNNTVGFFIYQSSSYSVQVRTNRVFRDTNAWYHVLFAIDTTQGTAADRVKIYINGVQETSMAQSSYPNQNQSLPFGLSSYNQRIGERNGDDYFDGCMSHFIFVDGTALTPSSFGETDSTTGQWKIKATPSVTFGSNGFFILKDSGSVTDQSGNSNNWTVNSGTLTNTEDCPSNNFATLNPLYYAASQYTLSQGNNSIVYATDSSRSGFGTIGMTDNLGKFYWEVKIVSDSNNKGAYGICDDLYVDLNATGAFIDYSGGYGLFANGQSYNGGTGSSYGNAVTTGDIVGVALDMDNRKLYFSKNGTWQNSGDPTSGSTGTGAAYTVAAGKTYFPAIRVRNGTNGAFNFGNGFFGTTAISSEGTNASGHGKFEYDVPTGYTALCTKGLNT